MSMFQADKFRKEVALFEARERVVDFLKNLRRYGSKKISWRIIRSNPMFHDLSEFYHMAAHNSAYRIGDGTTKLNPISAEDLADFVAKQVVNRETVEEDINVGGPETISIEDIGKMTNRIASREIFSTTVVSPGLASVAATLIKAVNLNAASLINLLVVASKTKELVAPSHGSQQLINHFRKLHEGEPSLRNPGFNTVNISSGCFYQRAFHVGETEVGSTIRWSFTTVEKDIMFGVFFSTIDDVKERIYDTLIQPYRVPSHQQTIEGSHTATKAGHYYIRWDNQYSKLTKKILDFKLTFEPSH
jgi:hypothetical protein